MYAQDNNPLPVWIILSQAHHHISINSQPFLVGIVSSQTGIKNWIKSLQEGFVQKHATSCVHHIKQNVKTCFAPRAAEMVFSMATAFPTIQREISGNQINIFGCEQINNSYALKGNQPREESTKTPLTPQNDPQVHVTSHVQTVEENSKFLTPRGIAQARVAKWLLHMLCYFSVVDLKATIETNAIWDNLVTESDLKLMELLYGTDIATMKGKNTRQCPHQLVRNVVSSPHRLCDAQCNVCLYIDIMYVNGMPFLTTVSKNIKYHTAIWVADCNPTTIAPLVESVLNLYQQASFQVSKICTDDEFKPVLNILLDDGWLFITNLANAQEYVPKAQQNNHIP